MKRLVLLMLALVLCVSVFASCKKNNNNPDDTKESETTDTSHPETPDEAAALEDAKAFLRNMYKDKKEATTADYNVVTVVTISGVEYAVEWTVEVTEGPAENVKVVVNEGEKSATVQINSQTKEEVKYVLKATIKGSGDKSVETSFKHTIPKYNLNTWEEYVEACKANDGKTVITVKGYVTAIVSATGSSSKGSMWIQDETGHAYYAYCPALTDEQVASREAMNKAFPVGAEVEVSGTVTTYGGCYEFNSGCNVKATGKTAKDNKFEIPYLDATADFGKAANNQDGATLEKYQAVRVSLKGVTLTTVDGSYYYFTINGVKYNIYRNNYFMEDADIEALFAKYVPGTKVDVTGVISVYSNAFQVYPDSVDSIKPSDVKLTDAEKIAAELEGVKIDATVTSDKEITLPLKGATNQDVTFAWTITESANVKLDAATGKCTFKVTTTPETVKLTVTAKCGSETTTKEYEVKVMLAKMSIEDAVKLNDGADVILTGVVAEITTAWSDQYKNISVTLKDATGELLLYRLSTNVAVGDVITVTGKMATYMETRQIGAGATAVIEKVSTSAEATAAADGTEVILKGKVTEINTAWSDQYKNITVTITDGAGTFYLYRLAAKVEVGDELIVFGKVGSYNGAKQLEAGGKAIITVKASGGEEEKPETPKEDVAASISFADKANRTSQDENSQVWKQNNITFTNNKGESISNVADYANPVRCYKGSNIKVEYTGMVKIVFNCNTDAYATSLAKSLTDGGATAVAEGKTVKVTFAAACNSFEAVMSDAQVRIDSIDICTK